MGGCGIRPAGDFFVLDNWMRISSIIYLINANKVLKSSNGILSTYMNRGCYIGLGLKTTGRQGHSKSLFEVNLTDSRLDLGGKKSEN
ncbi:hypothetical protein QQP08_001635 [Theobroma cacao]|nr:hypothetical protein QQP08_001635 [Theobroma cacao]